MQVLTSFLAFLIFIALVIGVHEFGHYLAARVMGVGVRAIGFGFGKPIYRKKNKTGVEIRFSPWLVGGYVSLIDSRNDKISDNEKPLDYSQKSIFARFIILISGVLMNLILAIFCFTLVFWAGLYPLVPSVDSVLSKGVFSSTTLSSGDRFISVGGHRVMGWSSFAMLMASELGEENAIIVKAKAVNGQIKTIALDLSRTRLSAKDLNFFTLLGFRPNQKKEYFLKYDFRNAFIQGIAASYQLTKLNLLVLGKIITGYISPLALSGPLVLFERLHFFFLEGVLNFIQFLALASIAIGIVNLLPIPGLDGGQILLLGIEKIRQRPLSLASQHLLQRLGYIILFILCMQLLANDFHRIALSYKGM